MNGTQALIILSALAEIAPILCEKDNSPKGFVGAVKPSKKVFRNQVCPCGSGKKSKRCCKGMMMVNIEAGNCED